MSTESKHIPSRSILKNSAINFGTQLLVVAVAFVCLPILVKLLSPSDFGLLSLLWAVIGYFTLFDFGISRAITKLLTSIREKQDRVEVSSVVWASLLIGTLIGIIGMLFLYVFSPALLNVLNIEQEYYTESLHSFRAASLGIPFMVLYGIIRGIQSAYYKFTLMNIFQFLLGMIQWVGSVVVVVLGYGLYEIILCIVVGRITVTTVSLFQLPKIAEGFSFRNPEWNSSNMWRLLNYGGWISVSQVLSPIFSYLDRFFIGRFVSIAAIGYYTIPSEMLSRILIIAMSLVGALFPALSEYSKVLAQSGLMERLYMRSARFLFIVLFPLTVLLSLFSYELLSLWVGVTAADHAYLVFIILSIGIFFNSMAQIPTTLLHAIGKPRITGLLNLLELPILIGLNFLLIPLMGIVGAALAWSARIILDCILLLLLANKNINRSSQVRYFASDWFLGYVLLFCALCGTIILWEFSILTKIALATVFGVTYATIAWIFALDQDDKISLRILSKKLWMA